MNRPVRQPGRFPPGQPEKRTARRLLPLILTAALLWGMAAVPSFAADTSQSYRFEMTAESSVSGGDPDSGGSGTEIDVTAGELITVTVTLTRTDQEGSYTVYAVQDDVLYDTRYFELIEESLAAGGSTSGIRCSVRDMSSAGAWNGYRQITASAVQATGRTWSNPQPVMTFQLRAIQEGTSQIVTGNCLVSNETGADTYLCESNDLTVRIAAQSSSGENPGTENSPGDAQEPDDPGDGQEDSSGTENPDESPNDGSGNNEESAGGTEDPSGNSGSSSDDGSDSDSDSGSGAVSFTDISSHWGREAIEYAVEQGYFSGVSETLFEPDGSMTRGMLVTVLWSKEGLPQASQVTQSAEFTDVSDGAWYAEAVKWAALEGIVSGYGDGRFGPEDPITREQMMVLFSGCAAYDGIAVRAEGDLSAFADAEEISVWAQDAVSWGVGEGLLSGTGNHMLNPKGTATRAQAAQLMMLLDEKIYHI